MGNLRRIVGVGLAVALVATLAVYVLIPKTGTTANNVVVNEPQNPTSGGTTSTTTGGHGHGGHADGSGTTPTPSTPPTRPPKAHGQNSNGPKHVICLPVKDHPGNGVSEYQGANQYRGQCAAGSALGAQGHGHQATAPTGDVASAQALFRAHAKNGSHGSN